MNKDINWPRKHIAWLTNTMVRQLIQTKLQSKNLNQLINNEAGQLIYKYTPLTLDWSTKQSLCQPIKSIQNHMYIGLVNQWRNWSTNHT